MIEWKPIETYDDEESKRNFKWALLANKDDKWMRFGFKYPNLNRWYYSTSYCRLFGSNEDCPTHWAEAPKGPWE